MPETVRIQKALADAGVASRRAAEALVAAGRVSVNGQPATIGQRVDPGRDILTVDGQPLAGKLELVYLALAKPAGVTSTVADRHAAQTVLELVPSHLRRRAMRLYPVGRLDRESEGLLLLTNDGAWAERLLHPRYGVEREYAVGLRGALLDSQRQRLLTGIKLEEGTATLDELRDSTDEQRRLLETVLGEPGDGLTWYQAVVRQGWRRQLRRMFAAVGTPIERLVRIRIGSLRIDGMQLGDVRPLGDNERRQLARAD